MLELLGSVGHGAALNFHRPGWWHRPAALSAVKQRTRRERMEREERIETGGDRRTTRLQDRDGKR